MFAPVVALLGGWLSKAWIYLAIAASIIAAVTAVLLGARQAGRNAERVDNLRRSLDAENQRKSVDLAVATGGDAERKRVRDAYSRD